MMSTPRFISSALSQHRSILAVPWTHPHKTTPFLPVLEHHLSPAGSLIDSQPDITGGTVVSYSSRLQMKWSRRLMEEGTCHRRWGDESERWSVDSGLNLRPIYRQYEKELLYMNRRKVWECLHVGVCTVCKSFSFVHIRKNSQFTIYVHCQCRS